MARQSVEPIWMLADEYMSGFYFWRQKLDDSRVDFHRAEMVRAFIESTEYHERFAW
jgi:hypothetical protein